MMSMTPTPNEKDASSMRALFARLVRSTVCLVDDDDDDAVVRRATRDALERALRWNARAKPLCGRASGIVSDAFEPVGGAFVVQEGEGGAGDVVRTADEMFLWLCARDGENGAKDGERLDALMDELKSERETDGDGIARVLFALAGTGGRGRDCADASSSMRAIDVAARAAEEARVRARDAMCSTPDVGRLRTRPNASMMVADRGEGSASTSTAFSVPSLTFGAVFGMAGAVDAQSSGEEDSREITAPTTNGVAIERSALVPSRGDSSNDMTADSSRWLATVDENVAPLSDKSSWDVGTTNGVAIESALDSKKFDSAFRRAFQAVKGLEREPIIASERDCVHVVLSSLEGCQTSADIVVSAVAREGGDMRFPSGTTLAFRNVLKMMAPAAERRCELDYLVERMDTPYMRPLASAIREILRAHATALHSIPEAVVERRLAESTDTVVVEDASEITLLELFIHTKRVRHQVDVIFNVLADERSMDVYLVPHAEVVRRLEESLTHVEDEETPMLQYLYSRAIKPVVDSTMTWMYTAAASVSNEFFINCASGWSTLKVYEEYRGEISVPCWLGGPLYARESENAEDDTLTLAQLRDDAASTIVSGSELDVLLVGVQLRILQRMPQSRAFAQAVQDAFSKISTFEAYTEVDARQWLNRIRLLESRIVALARESITEMKKKRDEYDAAEASKIAKKVSESRTRALEREKARLTRLWEQNQAKSEKRQEQLEELEAREESKRQDRLRRIEEERAWLAEREEKQREFERRKNEKKIAEAQERFEQEDAKLRWFKWQNARLQLADKRRSFIRDMESAQEESAVAALADALSLGVRRSAAPKVTVKKFVNMPRSVVTDEDEEHFSTEVANAQVDSMDVERAAFVLDVEKMDEDDSDGADSFATATEEVVERETVPSEPPTASDISASVEGDTMSVATIADDFSREYLGEAFGAPLPLLLPQEMNEIVTRQSTIIGRYTVSVFLDYLAFDKHIDAMLRFLLGGEVAFFDTFVENVQKSCDDVRSRLARTANFFKQDIVDDAVEDAGLVGDAYCRRLRIRNREESVISYDKNMLDLADAVECVYELPWPLNLTFAGVTEHQSVRHTQNAIFQLSHAATAIREVSKLIHAGSRSNALTDTTQTNIELRSRRLQKFSSLLMAFQHFVDALRGHVFEAIHVGAKNEMLRALRDSDGDAAAHDIGSLQVIIKRFCASAHTICFLRQQDSALKAMIDEGLQLALDLRKLLSSTDPDSLLTDGRTYAGAQQIHSKFHALVTQLCFRARVTNSVAASGLIERLDFNSFYLSSMVETDVH